MKMVQWSTNSFILPLSMVQIKRDDGTTEDIDQKLIGSIERDEVKKVDKPTVQIPTPLKAAAGVAGGAAGLFGAGKVLEKAGKTVYGLTLPPTAEEAGALQSYYAGQTNVKPRTAVETALETPMFQKGNVTRAPSSVIGQIGTRSQIGIQSATKAKRMFDNVINPIFQKAKEQNIQFSFDDLKQEAINLVKNNKRFSAQKKVDVIDDVVSLFDDLKGTTDLENLDLLKREIANKLPKKYFEGVPQTQTLQDARGAVSGVFRNKVHGTIKDVFGTNSAKIYQDYANLKGLAKMGKKSMTQGGLQGGAGSFVSTVAQETATPVTTTVGKVTYKVGKALQAPAKSIVAVGKKAASVIEKMKVSPAVKSMLTTAVAEMPAGILAEDFGTTVKKFRQKRYDSMKKGIEAAIKKGGKLSMSERIKYPEVGSVIQGKSKDEALRILREAQKSMGERPEEIKGVFSVLFKKK